MDVPKILGIAGFTAAACGAVAIGLGITVAYNKWKGRYKYVVSKFVTRYDDFDNLRNDLSGSGNLSNIMIEGTVRKDPDTLKNKIVLVGGKEAYGPAKFVPHPESGPTPIPKYSQCFILEDDKKRSVYIEKFDIPLNLSSVLECGDKDELREQSDDSWVCYGIKMAIIGEATMKGKKIILAPKEVNRSIASMLSYQELKFSLTKAFIIGGIVLAIISGVLFCYWYYKNRLNTEQPSRVTYRPNDAF